MTQEHNTTAPSVNRNLDFVVLINLANWFASHFSLPWAHRGDNIVTHRVSEKEQEFFFSRNQPLNILPIFGKDACSDERQPSKMSSYGGSCIHADGKDIRSHILIGRDTYITINERKQEK